MVEPIPVTFGSPNHLLSFRQFFAYDLARHVPMRAQMYYHGAWGVDSLTVKYTESGEMIRFSYRVVDPAN